VDVSTEFADRIAYAKARTVQIEREREKVMQEARDGRKQGRLSPSLVERIDACTPTQLRRVIERARENLRAYKLPPTLHDVRIFGRLKAHAAHGKRFYSLELRDCNKANCRKCPHGPYFIAHWKDGLFCRSKSLPFSRLPKPIRDKFGPVRDQLKADALVSKGTP
jgi:hypothetical protein